MYKQSKLLLTFLLVFLLSSSGYAAEEGTPTSLLSSLFKGSADNLTDLKGRKLSCKTLKEGALYQCMPSERIKEYTFKAPLQLVEDQHPFNGLAAYYNGSNHLTLSPEGTVEYQDESVQLAPREAPGWAGWRGRFNTFMVSAPQAQVKLDEDSFTLNWETPKPFLLFLGLPQDIQLPESETSYDFTPISYSHLWNWLGALCCAIEWLLTLLNPLVGGNWGWTIVLMAITIKILLLPFSILTVRYQRQVSKYQAILEPKLKAIKEKFDGEEAHNKIMAEYKTLKISPFYTLKPMVGSLVQVPVLVAIFNVLGELPALDGATFLWISNLAYPDTLFHMPLTLPLFGNEFNLLPYIMTVVTLFSTVVFKNRHAPQCELKKQKRNLYLMALAFFVLFYPFPAAMVLYWALANFLQFIQQEIVKI